MRGVLKHAKYVTQKAFAEHLSFFPCLRAQPSDLAPIAKNGFHHRIKQLTLVHGILDVHFCTSTTPCIACFGACYNAILRCIQSSFTCIKRQSKILELCHLFNLLPAIAEAQSFQLGVSQTP